MQFSKIKIAGFKSFVDPTTIALPSQLIAIVGPNGCGKSNIIDAVTWVMGESSPKYLRGEALTDVIFNGSSVRKPVGQASVELIFDNEDGSIAGEYAKFSEISIKRIISRDSDSAYYLNGVRCRKRDIVDIFLGTGLGPRSYSIIGQNMINRIVEAKPDELRGYLEEAAGISKYKERRHETELRLAHTKENLARVGDLRSELEKQLSHLKYQANVAEKFKTLKQQERVLQAERYAIEWRVLDSHMVDYTLQVHREETALEARHAELSETDRDIEQLRHEQRVAHDAFQEVQRRYYAVGNEITRIEQDILHHQERREQWELDLTKTEGDWQSIKEQMQETEDNLYGIEHDMLQLEPQFSKAGHDMATLEDQLTSAEESMQEWQQQWDQFNEHTAKTREIIHVENTNIEHLTQKISSLKNRQDLLQQEQGRVNFSELHKEVESLSKQSYEIADKLEFENKQLSNVQQEMMTLQAAVQDSNANLDNVRSELQRLRGQEASLLALQETALGQRDSTIAPWVSKHQLAAKSRLAQHIEVEHGWEYAVEKVLGYSLQAICVDKLHDVIPHLNDFAGGNLYIFTPSATALSTRAKKGTLLLQKIKSPWSLESLLSGIYVSNSLDEALKLCESLDIDESVITADGIWVNHAWLKVLKEENPAAGVFQREQELKQLNLRIDHLEKTQAELEKNIAERNHQIKQLEQKRDLLHHHHHQKQTQSAEVNAQQKIKQEQLIEIKARIERFVKEQEDCAKELKQTEDKYAASQLSLKEANQEIEKQTMKRETLLKQRDHVREALQASREAVQQKTEDMHELEIRIQTGKSQKTSLQQAISRLQMQFSSTNERRIILQSELTAMPPLDTIKKSLSRALDKHVSVEVELNSARIAMESLDHEFRNLEEKRQIIEREISKVRGVLETLRVELQGWKVKSETILEQLKSTEFTLESVLKDLSPESTAEEWQAKLEQVIHRVNKLGPINLVAIDEYATCLERKQYFDKQIDDLQSGLTTLEAAITKIDKETRTRFKETFDKVNMRFQELFPTIFGGGKSYLELTNDNLLEAGITVMACPPGKRNTSIYLLSGGEKSLTAIALIFSIFYLNPAPFCLLDEVDAALDDANVVRFTRLVKTMADKTQFIFISHNKITIEMAIHLIGVTMNEPGVSRLVSVDIEKAISLAGA